MQALMDLIGIEKTFPSDPPVKPLDSLDLTIESGSVVAITGTSGKGKSTLLSIMGGILRPDKGKVLYKGTDLTASPAELIDKLHRKGIGFVFQSPYLFQALTVEENLTFSLKSQGLPKDSSSVETILDEFGLLDRKEHLPSELSVGQKRRLVVARTLLSEHSLILADEPTNDLDSNWSDYVFRRLKHIADDPEKSVVIVTHDDAIAQRADIAYSLNEGRLSPSKGIRL